jgi:hypothetical protein
MSDSSFEQTGFEISSRPANRLPFRPLLENPRVRVPSVPARL